MGGQVKTLYDGITPEIIVNPLSQRAGSFSVNDTDSFHMRHIGIVQIFVDPGNGFIHGRADDINFCGNMRGFAQIQGTFAYGGFLCRAFGLCLCVQLLERMIPHCTCTLPCLSGAVRITPSVPREITWTEVPGTASFAVRIFGAAGSSGFFFLLFCIASR